MSLEKNSIVRIRVQLNGTNKGVAFKIDGPADSAFSRSREGSISHSYGATKD